MSSDGHDDRLRQVVRFQETTDAVTGFVAVHDRHRAIHEDQTVELWGVVVSLVGSLHHLEGLGSVECLVDEGFYAFEAHLVQLHGQTQNVIGLVINDQDASFHILVLELLILIVASEYLVSSEIIDDDLVLLLMNDGVDAFGGVLHLIPREEGGTDCSKVGILIARLSYDLLFALVCGAI